MPIPPPEARLNGASLAELLKLAYAAWSRFAYGNKRVYAAFWLVWLVLHVLRVYNTPAAFTSSGGLNLGLILSYIALNVLGVLVGAGTTYGGLWWSIKSWRGTNSLPMIAASVVTIIGLLILVGCPLFYEFFAAMNHSVYLCMIDLRMATRDACDAIVSEQYRQPGGPVFPQYLPSRP